MWQFAGVNLLNFNKVWSRVWKNSKRDAVAFMEHKCETCRMFKRNVLESKRTAILKHHDNWLVTHCYRLYEILGNLDSKQVCDPRNTHPNTTANTACAGHARHLAMLFYWMPCVVSCRSAAFREAASLWDHVSFILSISAVLLFPGKHADTRYVIGEWVMSHRVFSPLVNSLPSRFVAKSMRRRDQNSENYYRRALDTATGINANSVDVRKKWPDSTRSTRSTPVFLHNVHVRMWCRQGRLECWGSGHPQTN